MQGSSVFLYSPESVGYHVKLPHPMVTWPASLENLKPSFESRNLFVDVHERLHVLIFTLRKTPMNKHKALLADSEEWLKTLSDSETRHCIEIIVY